MDFPTTIELRADARVGQEGIDARAQARTETIRARHAAATSGPWHPVDTRHQQGGQIRLFAKGASGIIANVLRSGPNPGPDGELLGHAHQDIAHLLAEVDRHAAAVKLARQIELALALRLRSCITDPEDGASLTVRQDEARDLLALIDALTLGMPIQAGA